jgi:hypothetical protein
MRLLFTMAVINRSTVVFYYWLVSFVLYYVISYLFPSWSSGYTTNKIMRFTAVCATLFTLIGAMLSWQYPSHEVASVFCILATVAAFFNWFVKLIEKL